MAMAIFFFTITVLSTTFFSCHLYDTLTQQQRYEPLGAISKNKKILLSNHKK